MPTAQAEVEENLFGDCIECSVKNMTEYYGEDAKKEIVEIQKNLIFKPTGYPVNIYVIAVSKPEKNRTDEKKVIPCETGKPIGAHCYDHSADRYIIRCAGLINLGRFKVGYKLEMHGVDGWKVDVPLPESLLLKQMSASARKTLEKFKRDFSESDYNFSFIQCSEVFNG